MSRLRLKPTGTSGRVHSVTPQSAGWTYVGFEIVRLSPGQTVARRTDDRELCLVFVAGKGRASAGGKDFGELGKRMSPFDGPPAAVYIPPRTEWSVTATTDLDLALCSAPGGGNHPARVIDIPAQITRGKGSNTRYVTNILPETDPGAHSLLVVEVITPGGNTSSYPPHKHDTDRPGESVLEEIYYFELSSGPAGPGAGLAGPGHDSGPAAPGHGLAGPGSGPARPGLGYHRVYGTADRPVDLVAEVRSGDVVLVPHGWHGPSMAPPGYDLYYLNVMAGPAAERAWLICDDPAHSWIRDTWPSQPVDPRLPMASGGRS
jgi:5-deoxy-glucuronate isomerase